MAIHSAIVRFFALFAILNYVAAINNDNNHNDEQSSETKEEKVLYNGAQLLRIRDADEKLKKKLDELEESGVLEKWNANTSVHDIMVRSDKINEVSDVLSSHNAKFEIVIQDIQRAIQDENPEINEENEDRTKLKSEWRRDIWVKPTYVYYRFKLKTRKSYINYNNDNYVNNNKAYRLTWQRYHRYSDHQDYMNYLQNNFPDLVSIIDIGNSVEGRSIKVIKISSGQPGAKAMWIDGGTHAREWISPATVSYIVNELVENRAAHSSSISGIDFYIAPIINPDGYEYSHTVDRLWRKNRRNNGFCTGTDLNRNWGYKWGGAGSSKQPCKEIYAGSSAFSEPETKAVSNFILSKKSELKAFVTFHSYGQYILYPWGYSARVPPDYADLDRVGRKAAAAIQNAGGPAYTVGNSASTLYSASGGADDWAKGVAGIKYSYTIELRDNGRYGFVLPAQFIEPCGKESLGAIKVIAEEVNKLT
ncbi:carboxypeptidase B-like isoform X1 [Lycorma delicatula]|uniref:carboxypeptidase B-like isoform X1 n=1 Tax=Lycorma delicatula TaxID=130591 RepID=UPI003F50E28C